MSTDNVIARCSWQTTLDERAKAAELQNFISQWSSTALTEALDRCFIERCPANQTWRIDTLNLDLGEIALEDLAYELPRRLRHRLNDALDSLWMQQHTSMADGNPQNFQRLDQGDELQDFFISFLRHGRAPWWFQGPRSTLQMLDQLLAEQAGKATDIVRDLGRSEAVRRRMVWQLGEARVRRIIHLLEPWQGDFVCAYADHLFVVQARHPLVEAKAAEFRNHTWLNVLSYLLVDRGTLFNTAAFIQAGIARSAQQFGLDAQTLLKNMFQAMQAMQPMGGSNPVFLTAIKTIYQQDQTRTVSQPTTMPVDYWGHWQSMLRQGQARRTIGQDTLTYAQMFTVLIQQEPARMADLLRREGASSKVRQGMLRHLTAAELARVTRLLAPQDHLFILAHAEYTRPLMQLSNRDSKALWQVLLAYLLAHGSPFNRRQLVRETLQKLCGTQGDPFDAFVGLLIHSVVLQHPDVHGLELLTLLRELQGELFRQHSAALPRHPDWHNLLRYLESGKHGALNGRSSWRHLFDALLASDSVATQRRAIGDLLRAPQLSGAGDAALSQRLLSLTRAADFPRLLALLDPEAADFALSLLGRLLKGHRRGHLPALDRLDLAFQLPALLMQALPGFSRQRQGSTGRFEPSVFWQRLAVLLRQQGQVDIAALSRQLQDALPHDPKWRGLSASLLLSPGSTGLTSAYSPGPLEQLPAQLPPPQSTLKQWARLLLQSGCWQGAEAVLEQQLARLFWTVALDAQARHLSAAQLLARMTITASLRLNISLADMLGAYRDHLPTMQHSPWQQAYACLLQQSPGAAQRLLEAPQAGDDFQQDQSGRYLSHPKLSTITRHLLLYGRPPSWLKPAVTVDLTRLLHDLFHVRPDSLPALLGDIARQPAVMFRLAHLVPSAWLVEALRVIAPEQRPALMLFEHFRRYLENVTLPGVSRAQCEALLLQWVLPRSLAGDWTALAPEQLAGSFVAQVIRLQPVSLMALQQALEPTLGLLPEPLRLALSAALRNRATLRDEPPPAVSRDAPARIMRKPTQASPYFKPSAKLTSIPINNVGLVLLHSYIKQLFSLLGLIEDDVFISHSAQRRAVHYLQFLVTGSTGTPEHYLMLNKLLCGIDLDDPVESSIDMADEEKELCHGLLQAVIDYWPQAGSTSIEGFRGNWLARDGLLTDAGDHWDVKVERRAYDVLLARSSFSYSVIKLPWMEKALYVTWST